MSSFGTSPEVMQQTASQIDQVSQTINSQLNQLMGNIEPVASSWKGSASAAFQQLMAQWQQDAQKLTQALSDISSMMSQTGKNYASTEEANSSAIGNILGGLGG